MSSPPMFDDLPDFIMMQILESLPFRDVYRCQRVSPWFNETSRMALAEWKHLVLDSTTIGGGQRPPNRDVVQRLIETSRLKVTKLVLGDPPVDQRSERERIRQANDGPFWPLSNQNIYPLGRMVAPYEFPRMVELELRRFITHESFHTLLANNPQLRRLTCLLAIFPEQNDIVYPNLEYLRVRCFNSGMAETFAGKVPNLRTLIAEDTCLVDKQLLDGVFRSIPHLEHLELGRIENPMLAEVPSVWSLVNLRVLALRHNCHVDQGDIIRMARSFPKLESLHVQTVRRVTNEMFTRGFVELEFLRALSLNSSLMQGHVDDGYLYWIGARGHRLESIDLPKCVFHSTDVFVETIRSCPNLKRFNCFSVAEIDCEQDAIGALGRLMSDEQDEERPRQIEVNMRQQTTMHFSSAGVQRMLEDLATRGLKLNIGLLETVAWG